MSSTERLELPQTPIKNPEDLVAFHAAVSEHARALMKAKNHDYTGGDPDPFQNLREDGELGICVRLGDKIRRLKNFFRTGLLKVREESIEDTCLDVLNYAVLLLGLRRDQRKVQLQYNQASTRWEVSYREDALWVVHDSITQGYVFLDEDGCLPVLMGGPGEWPWVRSGNGIGALITSAHDLPTRCRVLASMPITKDAHNVQFSRGNAKKEN